MPVVPEEEQPVLAEVPLLEHNTIQDQLVTFGLSNAARIAMLAESRGEIQKADALGDVVKGE